MDTPLLELKDISKRFFSIQALDNVSLSLRKGSILGLVGENGAGKSTLMGVLGGLVIPEKGLMKLFGTEYHPTSPKDAIKAKIAIIHQELNLFTNLAIYENLYLNRWPKKRRFNGFLDKKTAVANTRKILERIGLDVSPEEHVEKLTPGQRQLVEIAKALSLDADIYLFDEPTTSLTPRETSRLFEAIGELKREGKGIIYVSHILEDVEKLTDDLVVLRDGRVTSSGKTDDFDIPKMIKAMIGQDFDSYFPEKTNSIGNENLLEARGICQPGIVDGIQLSVHKGEIVGLFGLMGSGRTELARILYGLDDRSSGDCLIGGKVLDPKSPKKSSDAGVAFITEDRRGEGLFMPQSIHENIGSTCLGRYSSPFFNLIRWKKINSRSNEQINRLNIKCGNPKSTPAKSLSGGNQQKVVIGKWLMTEPEVMILDEPTRGIDIGAKYEVYRIINELAVSGKGVLMISSELEEVMGVCDRILVMRLGRIVAEFERDEFNQERILAAAFNQMVSASSHNEEAL